MISVFVNLVLVKAFECNKLTCPTVNLNNRKISLMMCDLSCSIIPCHLDIFIDEFKEPLFKTFRSSDCYLDCIDTCEPSQLTNDECDSACNTAACGYDLGKCGYCAEDCKL
jgi:hypothetical protein